MEGTQNEVQPGGDAQVTNLINSQKNCTVNNDYKGHRSKEIFC